MPIAAQKIKGAGEPLAVESPACAVCSSQEFVGFGTIRAMTSGTVVADFLTNTISYQAQQHHFDQFAAVIEIAAGLQVTFAGIDPLPLKIADGWKER